MCKIKYNSGLDMIYFDKNPHIFFSHKNTKLLILKSFNSAVAIYPIFRINFSNTKKRS